MDTIMHNKQVKGSLAASLLLYILEVAVLHSIHPGVGLHHERLQDLLVPDGLGRQDDLDGRVMFGSMMKMESQKHVIILRRWSKPTVLTLMIS